MYASRHILSTILSLVVVTSSSVTSFTPTSINYKILPSTSQSNKSSRTKLYIFETKEKPISPTQEDGGGERTVEETTEKYGLEAGLFQSLKQEDGGQSAKDLLKKYGIAYLATSIPLAIVSFAICYALVDAGVDVSGLLGNVGIEVSGNGEKVGTFAIAYAAHKAASPIRFPPTVLLTPVVAKIIGKEPNEEEGGDDV